MICEMFILAPSSLFKEGEIDPDPRAISEQ
jgi:hypothetical protein